MSRHSLVQWFTCLTCAAALAACEVPPVRKAEIKSPVLAANGARTLAFQKVIAKIPLGDPIVRIQFGWWCAQGSTIEWRGGRLNVTDTEFLDAFRKELEAAHYPVVGDPYALFGDPSLAKAEILVGGLIEKVESNVCFPYSGSPNADIGNTGKMKGGTFMRITWQMYSVADNKVVGEITTEGSFQSDGVISGSFPLFFRNAFSANVRNLLADPRFVTLMKNDGHMPPDQRSSRTGSDT